MNSPVTLHDFVLNLISDADARTAFQLDPDGVLDAAGLSDVTPADVHDAIPLVFDYAPARVAGLSSGLSDLTSATLDRSGALNQLQPVTGQLTGNGLSTRDLTLTVAGSPSGAAG